MATIVVCDHDRVEGVVWQVIIRSAATGENTSFDCCSRACAEACVAGWAAEEQSRTPGGEV